MQKESYLEHGLNMIYLAASLLEDKLPDESRLRKMDLARIYELACFHSMHTIIFLSLQKCVAAYGRDVVDPELYALWSAAYARQLKRLLGLEVERARLTAFLERQGIWYLCLKGVVLQNYYPQFGMRQMSDNDILIDPSAALEVRKYMESEGYCVESFDVGCHDIYQKDGLYFETHRTLVSNRQSPKLIRYYENVKRRLVRAENGVEMRFTDEDFYVYFISHAHKHFMGNGYGVRFLMDTFVCTRALWEQLDRDYVAGELEKLSLADFERTVRRLSHRLFSDSDKFPPSLNENEREILVCCLSAGTFGTYKTHVSNILRRASGDKPLGALIKLGYLWRRLFPPFRYYKDAYPVLHRFIVTIPVLWIVRLIRGLGSPRRIAAELRTVKRTKQLEVE